MGPLLEIDQSNLPRIDGCTFGVCMLWTKIAEQSVSVNCRATRFDHCFHFRSIQASSDACCALLPISISVFFVLETWTQLPSLVCAWVFGSPRSRCHELFLTGSHRTTGHEYDTCCRSGPGHLVIYWWSISPWLLWEPRVCCVCVCQDGLQAPVSCLFIQACSHSLIDLMVQFARGRVMVYAFVWGTLSVCLCHCVWGWAFHLVRLSFQAQRWCGALRSGTKSHWLLVAIWCSSSWRLTWSMLWGKAMWSLASKAWCMLCVRLFGLLLLVVFLCHSIKHTIEQVVVLLQICLPGSPIKFSVMCFSLRDSLRFPNMTFQPIVLTVQDRCMQASGDSIALKNLCSASENWGCC